MRTAPVRFMSTAIGLAVMASLGYAAFGAVGCTVTVEDSPDGGTLTDTGGIDTNPTTDTGSGFAVIIPAVVLIGGIDDDVRDFGGGSTKTDIVDGGRVYNAYAVGGGTTSTEIGKDSTDKLVDGKVYGLPAGVPVTFTVTANLRGLDGDGPGPGTQLVPWATATCTATPSASSDVTATCTRKTASGGDEACTRGCLQLIPTLQGIVFSSDVLPPSYCDGRGATEFSLLRARQPFSGGATVSRTVQDCRGVIFVPLTSVTETAGKSEWGLSLEPTGTASACSLMNPCQVDRNTTGGLVDLFVVGSECQLTNASTGGTCF